MSFVKLNKTARGNLVKKPIANVLMLYYNIIVEKIIDDFIAT